jgi:hypothetical protein
MKSSKKAVNMKGANFEHSQITKQLDNNGKQRSNPTMFYNQGSSGAGTGSSGASILFVKERLKNKDGQPDDEVFTQTNKNYTIDDYYRRIDRFNYREDKKIYEEDPNNYQDDSWWEAQKKYMLEEENKESTHEKTIYKSTGTNREKANWEKEWEEQMLKEEQRQQSHNQ